MSFKRLENKILNLALEEGRPSISDGGWGGGLKVTFYSQCFGEGVLLWEPVHSVNILINMFRV